MSEHGRCGWSGGAWIPRCIGGAVGGRQQCTCPTRRAAEAAAREEALREEGRQQAIAEVVAWLREEATHYALQSQQSAGYGFRDLTRLYREHADRYERMATAIERGEHIAPKEGT